ncbi:MAG TPA: molybdenum cofactor biosynthesis protein MoaE [Fulvivirga sp.]|nr:molybdenum cofactor biosynthesis protein MoaE [Fulvivirga sp.]
MIQIKEEQLSVEEAIKYVSYPACGGINTFVGTVRNSTKGRNVLHLEFEAYPAMAILELKKIAERAKNEFGAFEIAILHRIGKVEIGEAAVVIAVSSPHREASFAACKFAIDTLKNTVPIWKKEIFEDGEVWVSAHP